MTTKPEPLPAITPHSYYWPLFRHMADEHALWLVDSELDEIVRVAERMRRKTKTKRKA